MVGHPLRSILPSGWPDEGTFSADIPGPNFQFSAPIQSGNSGSPVFDGSGRVIGIVVSALHPPAGTETIVQGVNFAVKADAAQQLAQSYGVHLTFSESAAALSLPDINDQVKSRVLPLNCKS